MTLDSAALTAIERLAFGDAEVLHGWPLSTAAREIREERLAELGKAFEKLQQRIHSDESTNKHRM